MLIDIAANESTIKTIQFECTDDQFNCLWQLEDYAPHINGIRPLMPDPIANRCRFFFLIAVATTEDSPIAMKLKKMWLKAPITEEQATLTILDPSIGKHL